MSGCLQLLVGVDTSCLLAEIVSHLLVRQSQSCVVFSQLMSCVNYYIPSGDTICGLVMERSSSGVARDVFYGYTSARGMRKRLESALTEGSHDALCNRNAAYF